MPRRTAQQARAAILSAAVDVFRSQGYAAATLEDVAASVQVTRGAVLYHFKSKADLLHALVEPLLADLDDLLAGLDDGRGPTVAYRREVITACTKVLLRHRPVVELVVRDLATYGQRGVQERISGAAQRLIDALGGSEADTEPATRVRAIATINLLTATVASRQQLTFDDPAEYEALIDAALGALCGARP